MSPSKSERQRRALIAKKGIAWVRRHHFDKIRRSKKKGTK